MLEKLVDWYTARKLGWISDVDQLAGHAPMVVPLRSGSGLIPLPDGSGAILIWTFDYRPGGNPMLLVRLTEQEAQAVYDADPFKSGMLEPVRRHLRTRHAVMTVRCGPKRYILPFRIPALGPESLFVKRLDLAADSCPAYRLHRVPMNSSAPIRSVYRAARTIAYA